MPRITSARIENYARIKTVFIQPSGDLIVIGGRNGQGKSSVLNAIAYAITGQKPKTERPVREGEKRADVEVTLDDGTKITQYVTEGADEEGNRKVTYGLKVSRDGMNAASPAEFLARLTSKFAFDPMEFVRSSAPQQGETLRKLLDLDWAALDARRKEVYDSRTTINREVRDLEGLVDRDRSQFESLPDETLDAADLAQRINDGLEHNRQLAFAEQRLGRLNQDVRAAEAELKNVQEKLARLLRERGEAESEQAGLGSPADVATMQAEYSSIDRHNSAVRDKRTWLEKTHLLETRRENATNMTGEIEAIDERKREMLANVNFPVPGLSFDADGLVMLDGIPFPQAASSQQVKTAAAIALELSGPAKVLFIREGALLDEDSLNELQTLADMHDAQVFLEVVGEDFAGIIIEDGQVQE